MTAAKDNFFSHLSRCDEALVVYDHLTGLGYSADFGLRYVWVASVSALDHYISQVIVELASQQVANNQSLTAKLLNERLSISLHLEMKSLTDAAFIFEFRKALADIVRYRSFQKDADVADGLSYIWNEAHKWDKIAARLTMTGQNARRRLNSIVIRRDQIVHNADYNESLNALTACTKIDASNALGFIKNLVTEIDYLITE